MDYLYSVDDQRIYKKVVTLTETTEDYYLMDGMGKTVAILHSVDINNDGVDTQNWEYFASGAERECRLMPTADQAPVANVNNSTGVRFGKDQVSFYLYDHLGNTRITYTPIGFISHPGDPTIAVNKINTVVDYFTYGKVLREFVNGDQERYLTTQHERDQETDLDYRGARYYDGDVGRFLSLDPLAVDFPAWSAYNYVMGNPVAFVDPDGKAPKPPKQAVKTIVHYITLTLMEEDGVSDDDYYGHVTYVITTTTYDDESLVIEGRMESGNQTGVGISGDLTINPSGIINGSMTMSEGDQTISETSSSSGTISMKIPGSDIGVSGGSSKNVSVGIRMNGASSTIGFSLVYNTRKNLFDVVDDISESERERTAEVLKDAESFPDDGIGNVWYGGYDNQELYVTIKYDIGKNKH